MTRPFIVYTTLNPHRSQIYEVQGSIVAQAEADAQRKLIEMAPVMADILRGVWEDGYCLRVDHADMIGAVANRLGWKREK